MLESIWEFFNLQRSIPKKMETKKMEMKKIITSASNVSTLYLLNFCAKIDCKNGYYQRCESSKTDGTETLIL